MLEVAQRMKMRFVFDASTGIAEKVAEAPWSVAEWAVGPRFDKPRATLLVLMLG